MKPFPIPVVPEELGGQTEDDGLEYMVMPQGMETYKAPVLPEPEEMADLVGAHEALRHTITALEQAMQGACEPHAVNLDALNEAERRLINQVLGEGEVAIRVQANDAAHGEWQMQESVFAGVWRVLGQAALPEGAQAKAFTRTDLIEAGRIPSAVLVAAQAMLMAPAAHIAAPLADGRWPAGVMNAPAILEELADHVHTWQPGQPAHVINLTLLPLSPEDLALVNERLGQGPIQILSRGYGNCRVTHTGLPRCWRVSYFNSQDALILDTIEVTDLPEVACAAREDLEDSHERLADMLQWVEGGA
jgi:hydrogenase-1 operon protein HyaF